MRFGIFRVLLLLWMLGFCLRWEAQAAIQYVSLSSSKVTSASSLTWAHSTNPGSNQMLLVQVGVNGPVAITSVTYGGVPLTEIGTVTATTRTSMYLLVAPPANGNSNVVITLASSAAIIARAVTFSGVDQINPVGSFFSATSASPTSRTIASATGELVVDFISAAGGAGGMTPGSGQTQQISDGTGNASTDVRGSASVKDGAASVTMSYSFTAGNTGALGVLALKPAGSLAVSGTVFEDVNYGGGAGRTRGASSGVVRSGARVELFGSSGNYGAATTTDASGNYAFSGLSAGNYTVRVVNSTVTSSRTGYTASCLPVQTFRTDASSGTAVAVTDFVGGANPALIDAGNGSTTLAALTTATTTAQSTTAVTVGSSSITGVDFGFNFDTVVTVRDSGQGSLRQVITNANTLGGDGSLAQSGRTAAVENAIFMISNGSSAAGLRAANNYFTSGVTTITPTSVFPAISSTLILDAQTQPGWSSTPIVILSGASAGSGHGLNLSSTAANCVVRGFVIGAFASGYGLQIDGTNATIESNYIGTNAAGTAASANGSGGIYVGGTGATIGGTTASARNVISGNTGIGLNIAASNTTVQGNYIGLNAAGTGALANSGYGVQLIGGSGNVVGGTTAGARNVISGNGNSGVAFGGGSGAIVQGNYIGTNPAGTAALANSGYGVAVFGSTNPVVGGTVAGAGNVISGNANNGISITASGTTVHGNYIGTNAAGTAALGNNGYGVQAASGTGSIIGGTAAGAGNVISGNTNVGLVIDASSTTVQGNYFGTNAGGTAAIANGGFGVYLRAGSNLTVGGTVAGAGNVISGNSNYGLYVKTTGSIVQGNYIGTNAAGTSALANASGGVFVNGGTGNTFGGTTAGAGNLIRGNNGKGVTIDNASTGNAIQVNSIYGNTGIGIDLGNDGVTANDGAKNSAQANYGMDKPVFTSATLIGTTLRVVGYVGSAPSQSTFGSSRVEIFKSDANGSGQTFLGFLTADASGNFNTALSVSGLSQADAITATATDGSGNTSEFSARVPLAPGISGLVYLDANHNAQLDGGEAGTGQTLYAKLIPTSTPSGPATQAVTVNGTTGAFVFADAGAGSYTIVIDNNATLSDVTPTLPAGYIGTEQPNQTRTNVTVGSGPVPGQNFGLFAGSRISGAVFADLGGGSGGVANDGTRNGSEAGLAGAVVKATNSAGTTVYDTATTDATGAFTLYVGGVTGAVKITETNAPGTLSTGASLGTGGTYTRATDTIAFTLAAGTSYTGVNFGDVPEHAFNTDGQLAGLPGTVVVYAHSFIAGTAGQVSFSTTNTATPANAQWSRALYRDTNGNGRLDAGEPPITGAITVTAGQKLDLLVKEAIPANAAFGATNNVTLTASFSFTGASPALTTTSTRTDLTTVGQPTNAGLTLTKTVNKTTALPGETLTYTITYTNQSSQPLTNVVIYDQTPAFTTFTSASNSALPNTLTAIALTAPTVGTTGPLRWTFTGTLAPAGTGTVTFTATLAQ